MLVDGGAKGPGEPASSNDAAPEEPPGGEAEEVPAQAADHKAQQETIGEEVEKALAAKRNARGQTTKGKTASPSAPAPAKASAAARFLAAQAQEGESPP